MAQPLVSIIVPSYNRAKIIPRAIQSALNQTYNNIELIVVDDGSSDNTKDTINLIKDSRLRFLEHDTNRGGGAARNTGIKAAQGEYIALLDSDDEWIPDKLTIQITAMQAGGYLFCYSQAYKLQESADPIKSPKHAFTGENLLKYIVSEGGVMQSSGFIVHRDVSVFFDESFSVHQDWDWVLQIYKKTPRFLFIDKPLYYFHTDAPFRTASRRSKPLIDRAQPFLKKYAKEINSDPAIHRYLYWAYAYNAFHQGEKKLARSILSNNRVYPSLFKKPGGVILWLKTLMG